MIIVAQKLQTTCQDRRGTKGSCEDNDRMTEGTKDERSLAVTFALGNPQLLWVNLVLCRRVCGLSQSFP